VLGPEARTPRVLDLGSASEIDNLVFHWQAEASSAGNEDDYRRAGDALRQRIWDPVARLFGESSTVFVVPDGSLNLVNLAALPAGHDDYLVEHGPLIHMLSAERALVPRPPAEPVHGRPHLLALGNPDFDAVPGEAGEGTVHADIWADKTESNSPNNILGPLDFPPLPATAGEIETILTLWREVNGDQPGTSISLTGPQATEARFKRLAPGNQILHIATHGFVLGGPSRQSTASLRGVGGLVPAESSLTTEEIAPDLQEKTFLLSGLALAGANIRHTVEATAEDGVLTSIEVANLDLSSVQWAVLSACDSGVGKTIAGEGVFGFRRSFRIAGARTVIMSLWPVEDAGGQDWMEALYRARLIDGMTTAEAVRHAGRTLLAERRRTGQSTHPFYWGAFVASGAWQ